MDKKRKKEKKKKKFKILDISVVVGVSDCAKDFLLVFYTSMSKSASKKHSKKQDKPDVLEQLRKLAKKHKKSKEKSSKKTATAATDKAMIPMTKNEYEKKRSIITTEYDAQTGRMRYY